MANGEIGSLLGGRVYKVSVYMLAQQQQIQFGFHLRDTGLATTSAQECVDYARDWLETNYRPVVPNDYSIMRMDALELTTKEYAQHEYINTKGTFGAPSTANFLAALVQLRSAQRARHRNGRMFWPLRDVDANSQLYPGTLTPMTAAVDAFRDKFMGNAVTNSFKAVIVSAARPASPTRPAITHSWIDVETIRISNLATALRRRKVGVGS